MKSDSIAIVSPRFPESGAPGGAETLLCALAQRLARHGKRVTFLATCAKNHFTWHNELPAGRAAAGPFDVIRFPVDEGRDTDFFHRIQTKISRGVAVSAEAEQLWLRNSVHSTALCDFLRADPGAFDCVLAGPYLFGLVDAVSRIYPDRTLLVPCLHDEPYAYLGVIRDLLSRVRGFMFNSEPERDLAMRLMQRSAQPSTVVGMGMEPFAVDPEAFAKRHSISQPYVLYSGRREGGKGTPILLSYLDVFRLRTGRDVKLVLTGSGSFSPSPTLARHILDAGFVSETEKHEAMAGATAFVHPSTYESFGIVLLESFLAGTPGLVHAGSAVLQWQCRRSAGGLWFRNYPEFEEELAILLDRPELRRTMGENGRRYVLAEYAWEAVDRRLLDSLRDA